MIATNYLTLRETADALGIESWRVARLARILGIEPADKRLPAEQAKEMARLADPEDRYAAVRSWLLRQLREERTVRVAGDHRPGQE